MRGCPVLGPRGPETGTLRSHTHAETRLRLRPRCTFEMGSFLLESCSAAPYNAFSLLLFLGPRSPKYFALLLILKLDQNALNVKFFESFQTLYGCFKGFLSWRIMNKVNPHDGF